MKCRLIQAANLNPYTPSYIDKSFRSSVIRIPLSLVAMKYEFQYIEIDQCG